MGVRLVKQRKPCRTLCLLCLGELRLHAKAQSPTPQPGPGLSLNRSRSSSPLGRNGSCARTASAGSARAIAGRGGSARAEAAAGGLGGGAARQQRGWRPRAC